MEGNYLASCTVKMKGLSLAIGRALKMEISVIPRMGENLCQLYI
jgi:hypothetical protein